MNEFDQNRKQILLGFFLLIFGTFSHLIRILGVWQVPMVMWQDLNGGRCSMGDACSNPPDSDGVVKMIMKNFERHYLTNR